MKKIVEHFHKYGYGLVPDFLSPQQCDNAVKEIDRLIEDYHPTEQQMLAFHSQSDAHARDKYFKESAGKVSFFFEPKALKDGKLIFDEDQEVALTILKGKGNELTVYSVDGISGAGGLPSTSSRSRW